MYCDCCAQLLVSNSLARQRGQRCSSEPIGFLHLAETLFIDHAADMTERCGSGSVLIKLFTSLEKTFVLQ